MTQFGNSKHNINENKEFESQSVNEICYGKKTNKKTKRSHSKDVCANQMNDFDTTTKEDRQYNVSRMWTHWKKDKEQNNRHRR